MFESAFRLLFKYRPIVFEQGTFAFGVSRPLAFAVLVVGAAAVSALLTYRALRQARGRVDAFLVVLRICLVILLVFCLMRPTVALKAAVPQQNFLGILIDDSRSMQIAGSANEPRSAFVGRNLVRPGSTLLDALSRKFVLRFFRFSSSAHRIETAGDLRYEGAATRLGQALDRAQNELSGLPLAGLVMVSDGADTSDVSLDESLASLKARAIPVFTVGVGEERFTRDIQVSRVETPRSALKGTSLTVNVAVAQIGYAGATVPLIVEDEGRVVSTQDLKLPTDGETTTVRVRFPTSDAGPRTFRFRVPPQPGEQVTGNNARDALVEISDRREKVLYIEGEPRFEAKFVRRAVEDDKNLQVVILQRTAENKYLRLDVDKPDELVGGFPKTRDELFVYRGVILGSIEADSFTPDQIQMLVDFVSRRGGGLLMLGGRRSFAEGGWTGTPLAEVLPVLLEANAGRKTPPALEELAVRPTRDGAVFPVTQIGDSEDASAARWPDVPALTSVNPIRRVRPGATILLTGVNANNKNNDSVVLAFQPYGRGKALALPVQDSWLWRMHASVPVGDSMHTTFWRRLIRWLVEGVPGPVVITSTQDHVDPEQPLKLSATVADGSYVDVNDGRVFARVTSPSGKSTDVPMEWRVSRDGEYQGLFVPDEQGLYSVEVSASRTSTDSGPSNRPAGGAEKVLGTALQHVRVSGGDAEYFDATMRAPLLRRIAEETGGRFYAAADAADLPDAVGYSGRGVTLVEEHELWDMPVLLLLLVGLLGGEWALRRARGLA